MKSPKGTGLATIIVFCAILFTFVLPLRAQSNALSPSEFQALVQALETTTPLPASAAPRFGNFYTIQHGESWPPLPGDIVNLPFWDLGGGWYVLADTNYDWTASQAQSQSAGLSRMDDGLGSDFQPQLFTTNQLWLQITGVTNGIASLVIHPVVGTTNGIYDLEYTSDPDSPWQWVLRTAPGQTNLSVANATNEVGFYRLAPPNDLTANDSLGTNFWLAFLDLDVYADDNILTLYISSTFGASGTVSIPNQLNGTNLFVSNSDGPDVDGTYLLTNELVDPGAYGLRGGTISNAWVNGQLLVFYDATEESWYVCESNNPSYLYDGESIGAGPNLLNDVEWFINDIDQSLSTLTSSCAPVPLTLSFSISAGTVTNVPIPRSVMLSDEYDAGEVDIGTNNGINVTASEPVSGYALDYDQTASAAFTCYPTTLLGNNYCVLARPSNVGLAQSEFAIVATASNTTVTITPSPTANLYNHPGTGSFTNNLQPGETYEINHKYPVITATASTGCEYCIECFGIGFLQPVLPEGFAQTRSRSQSVANGTG